MKNNARRTFTPTGRGKSLTPGQIGTARRLKADGLSIRAIAEAIGSSRATVHRALTDTNGPMAVITTDLAATLASTTAEGPAGQGRLVCPGCGSVPDGEIAAARLRDELQTESWSTAGTDPGRVEVTRHCGRCQPHTVYAIACLACGDGPLLTGELVELARETEPQRPPETVVDQLTATGWRWATTTSGDGWVCPEHTGSPMADRIGWTGP
ncbi:helix-turn-helix domain-containing protein [Kribbella sp. NPDC049227]|uniref:helix-turn-helix domain-containing protein n=1 Tax=Kribbella sp. NPDC049227 TaxID=3364113 RepID=UPI0037219156